MRVRDFLNRLNFNSDALIEVCDVTVSLDNRQRIPWREIHAGKCSGFANRKLQSFTVANGKITIYAE